MEVLHGDLSMNYSDLKVILPVSTKKLLNNIINHIEQYNSNNRINNFSEY